MSVNGETGSTLEFKTTLNDQITPVVEKAQVSLDQFSQDAVAALQALGPAMDKQAENIASGFEQVFRTMREEAKRVSDETAKAAADAAKKQRESMLGVATAVASYGIAGRMKAAIVEWAAAGDEMLRLSSKTGIAAEELSALSYSARLNDVPMAQMTRSLQFLSRAMVASQRGTGEAAEAFKALGINAETTPGKLKRPLDMFFEVAGALNGVGDQAKMSALAMRLFGESGNEMLPMLNNIADIKAQMGDAGLFGLVQTKEQLEAASRMDDAITRMEITWGRMKGMLAGGVAQTFSPLLSTVQTLISGLLNMGDAGQTAAAGVTSIMTASAAGSVAIVMFNNVRKAVKEMKISMSNALVGIASFAIPLTLLGMWLNRLQRDAEDAAKALADVTNTNVWDGYIREMEDAGSELRELQSAFDQLSRIQGDNDEAWTQLKASQAEAARVLDRYPGLLQSIGTNFTSAAEAARVYGNAVRTALGMEATQVRQALAAAESDLARVQAGEARKAMIRANPLAHNPAPEHTGPNKTALDGPDMHQVGLLDQATVNAQILIKQESIKRLRALDRGFSETQRAQLLADERTIKEIKSAADSEQEKLLKQHNENIDKIDDLATRARTKKEKAEVDSLRRIEDQRYARESSKAAGGGGGKRADELAGIVSRAQLNAMQGAMREWQEYQQTLAEIDKAEGASWERKEAAKQLVTANFSRDMAKSWADAAGKARASQEELAGNSMRVEEAILAERHAATLAALRDLNQYRAQVMQANETVSQTAIREFEEQKRAWDDMLSKGIISQTAHDEKIMLAGITRDRKLEEEERSHQQRMRQIQNQQRAAKVSNHGWSDEEAGNLNRVLDLMDQIEEAKEKMSFAKDASSYEEAAAQMEFLLMQLEKMSTLAGPNRFTKEIKKMLPDMRELAALAAEFMAAFAVGDVNRAVMALARLQAAMKKTEKSTDETKKSIEETKKPFITLKDTAGYMAENVTNAMGQAAAAALGEGKNFAEAVHEALKALALQEMVMGFAALGRYFASMCTNQAELSSATNHFIAAALAGGGAAATAGASSGGGSSEDQNEAQKHSPRDYSDEDLEKIRAAGSHGSGGGDDTTTLVPGTTSGSVGRKAAAGGGGWHTTLNYSPKIQAWDGRDASRAMKRMRTKQAEALVSELVRNPKIAKKLGALSTMADL